MTHNHDVEYLEAAKQASQLAKTSQDNIILWLTEPKYAFYQEGLKKLITRKDWKILNDGFFQSLPFGTGGRRGTVGIGPNRINRITIGEAAQGLADYLLSVDPQTKEKGIVIACDTRLTAKEFTTTTTNVFLANGFKTYVFDGFRPTPELSFAVRHLKTAGGVVISASHNPPSDNGFKVYWQDGGQLVSPHAEALTNQVNKVTTIQSDTDLSPTIIGPEIDKAYIEALIKETLTNKRSASIVYSPLHGTGSQSVIPALREAGFKHLQVVEEQNTPDGNFPTVANHLPNPEIVAANDVARQAAAAANADIAITTDPDADRLGVIAHNKQGLYQFLNGNQIAACLGAFVADQMSKQQTLLPNHFMVKTIVTTDLLTAIAKEHKIILYDDILIGFKYIADLIYHQQDCGNKIFLFGGEESHGILKGSYTRDKDAAIAALLIAELVSTLKEEDRTLIDYLHDLYKRYGIYTETLSSIYYEGANGHSTMQLIMDKLRQRPPERLGTHSIVSLTDRLTGRTIALPSYKTIKEQNNTRGNVLILNLSKDSHTRLTIRPSGTEPKLKIYTQTYMPIDSYISDDQLTITIQNATQQANDLTKTFTQYLSL